jgi:hypothetical protein
MEELLEFITDGFWRENKNKATSTDQIKRNTHGGSLKLRLLPEKLCDGL